MSDPVFLITGASNGIGAETAHQAARAGYRLAPFFDEPPQQALAPADIAAAALYAVSQPAQVDVNEIMMPPTPPPETG